MILALSLAISIETSPPGLQTKDPEGSDLLNGAGKGVLLEHLSKFFNVVKTEEYQEVEYKLQKLVA